MKVSLEAYTSGRRTTQLNILLTTLGSTGDVNPFLAIGQALRDRSHRVTLNTSSHFQEVPAQAGLAFAGLGTREDYAQVIDDPDLWEPHPRGSPKTGHIGSPQNRP
jgi:UDP:flavonoid glycosyltransferase YjiC (YdhE family)